MAIGLFGASAAWATAPETISDYAGNGSNNAPTPGPATGSALANPSGVAVDSAGNVYIADSQNSDVEKVTPDGTLSILAGNGSSGAPTPGPASMSALGAPQGVAVDADGNLYIADPGNGVIEKIAPDGTLSVLSVPGVLTPFGVTVGPDRSLYIADDGDNTVKKLSPDGTVSTVAGNGGSGLATAGPATSSALDSPNGLAVDANGDLYIADAAANEVVKVTAGGTLSIISGNGTVGAAAPGPATASELSDPTDVALDAAGNLYIADYDNSNVEKVTPDGTLSTIAGTGSYAPTTFGGPAASASLGLPSGLAFDSEGNLYIADYGNNTVDLISPPVPADTAPPLIIGTPTVGQTLTASTGSWSPTPSSYAYQWQDCDSSGAHCVDISGATARTYTLVASDVGHTVRVEVTAANGGGLAAADSSVSGLIVAPAAPTPPTPPTPTPTPPTGTPRQR